MSELLNLGKTKSCPYCGELIHIKAVFCKFCRMSLDFESNETTIQEDSGDFADAINTEQSGINFKQISNVEDNGFLQTFRTSAQKKIPANSNWNDVMSALQSRGFLGISSNIGKTVLWFTLANFAVLLTLLAVSGGSLLPLAPVILLVGCTFPFVMLLFSKKLSRYAHDVYQISPGVYRNSFEENLYNTVQVLSQKAGLLYTPEVWVYQADDINAFATGPSRANAAIAFSTGLLNRLDARGVAAVAAHEIAHIANGDMLTLTIVQSVINMVSLLITIPLWIMNFMACFVSGAIGELGKWLLGILTWIITAIVFILGIMVQMAFSRRREYAADAIAAKLVDTDSMIHTLEILGTEIPLIPVKQQQYAAFRINNKPGCMQLLSSHPTIDSRIAKLYELNLPY